MKIFLRLVSLDIRKSLASQWLRYAISFVVAFVLTILAVLYARYYYSIDASSPYATAPFTLGDGIINLFSGNSEYIPSGTEPYVPPVTWLTIVFLGIFTALDYPWSDLTRTGRQAILICGSRTLWWLSKCVWTVFNVAFFLIILGLGIAAGALITDGTLSFDVSEQVPLYLEFDPYALQEAPWDIVPLLAAFPAMLCALCLLQHALALIVHPLPSFGIVAILLYLSAYFTHALLPGEYLMAARSSVLVSTGFSPAAGILFAAIIASWTLAFGTLWFKHTDLIPRRDS